MTSGRFLYAGTFAQAGAAPGIHVLRAVPNGAPEPVGVTAALRPGWLVLHPSGRFLYAVNEVLEFARHPGGGVSAFAIDQETGQLSPLNTQRTAGRLPCHCAIDPTGQFLLVATHADGTVELLWIAEDGSLGPVLSVHRHSGSGKHPRRQASPHAHSVNLDPAGRFALVPDLGTDRVAVYELDAGRRTLTPHPERDARIAPGSGPRHMAFHPDRGHAYLINELAATITAFFYDAATGRLRQLQTVSTLPDGFPGHHAAAEVAVHPSGRFLYASNRSYGSSGEPPVRGEDSIVWFGIDARSGELTPRGRVQGTGESPRSFVIDASRGLLYLASQRGDHLESYLIDASTGALSATGQVVPVPAPVCVQLSLLAADDD